MSYLLKELTMRTNNSTQGLDQIQALWNAIFQGTLPILFNQKHELQTDISLVSKYSNYASDETGEYDLSIIAAPSAFFETLETQVKQGFYVKLETIDEEGDGEACTKEAWKDIWAKQVSGHIARTFTADYERTIPKDFSADGKAHCTLYIAVTNS